MNVLIRYLRQRPDGVTEAQDSEVTLDDISIGSAADRNIQLIGRDIGAKHAQIGRASCRERV